MHFKTAASLLVAAGLAIAGRPADPKLAKCPGYKATNVRTTCAAIYADLELAGPACDAYGKDIANLTLVIKVEDGTPTPQAHHVHIPLTQV